MSKKPKLFALSVLVALCFYYLSFASPSVIFATNKLDFSQENFTTNTFLNLGGSWTYFPELLSPNQVKEALDSGRGEIITLPSSFDDHTGQINGYATYASYIHLPEESLGEIFAIYVPWQYSAYELFVEETRIAQNGIVGIDPKSHQSEMAPRIGYFLAHNEEILLTLQISSFEHIRGGSENSIYLGHPTAVVNKFNNKQIITLFLNGGIFIMGLFMLLLSVQRGVDLTYGVFGLFCFFISSRSFFAVPFFYTIFLPKISWLWGTRLEYLFTLLSSGLFVILLWLWYRPYFSRRVMVFYSLIHGFMLIITLTTKPVLFQTLFFNIFILAIPLFAYLIYIMYLSRKEKSPYIKANKIGIAIVLLAVINEFFKGKGFYSGAELMLPAVAFYALIYVSMASHEFATQAKEQERLNQKLQNLNESLDKNVRERTFLLETANKKLEEIAWRDGLTGAFNRHKFDSEIENILDRSKARNIISSLLMIDIDEFKPYNDHYGHVQGDIILKKLVLTITELLPQDAILARYGGEEFAVIIENYSRTRAVQLAEKIRETIDRQRWEHTASRRGNVTVSIGVASLRHFDDAATVSSWIKKADQRLYLAKARGRNQVV